MKNTKSAEADKQNRIMTTLSAIVHTFLCAVWVVSFFSAGGTIGKVFCLLLTFASGTITAISWVQLVSLWKRGQDPQNP